MKRWIAAALCVLAITIPMQAFALDAAPYNAPGTKMSASCNAWVQDYAPDQNHAIYHVSSLWFTPSYAKDVAMEMTVTYQDGRTLTWLVAMRDSYENDVQLEAPRFDGDEPRTLRCSVAFGLLPDGWYVAPWVPLSAPAEFAAKHSAAVAPVPGN